MPADTHHTESPQVSVSDDEHRAKRSVVTPKQGTKGERTRERILDTALALFAQSGSNAVSLRSIAAKSGISHSGLLRYFTNKNALVLAAIEHRDILFIRTAGMPLDHFTGRSVTDDNAISLLFDAMRYNTQTPGTVAIFVKLSAEATAPDHPAHQYFERRYAILVDKLSGNFAQRTGATPDQAERMARQFIAFTDGIQIQWLLDPKATDMQSLALDYLHQLGVKTTDL